MTESPAQELEKLVAFLEGTESRSLVPTVNFSELTRLTPVRMRLLGKFWQENGNAGNQLGLALGRLIGGFANAAAPWGVVIQCIAGEVRFHWMVAGGNVGALSWSAMAAAALPGADWMAENVDRTLLTLPSHGRRGVALLARHPRAHEGAAHFASDLSRLVVAMQGSDWTLALLAQPVAPDWLRNDHHSLHRARRETQLAWGVPGGSEHQVLPQARHALALLDAEAVRYEEGASTGMWDIQAGLFADNPATLSAGAAAWRGQLATAELPLRAWSFVSCLHDVRLQGGISSRLTTRETAALVPLPYEDTSGIALRERVPFAQERASSGDRSAIAIGRVLADGRALPHWLDLRLSDVPRHGLICGSTRSGKSQTAQFLARQLWEEHRIPFLILDPAKSDYRRLLRSPLGRDLRIFTPGLAGGAMFAFNPLAVPHGVPVQMHMDGVRDLLLAAFGWVEPMPSVLTLALEVVYRVHGWDLQRNTHRPVSGRSKMPTLQSLIDAIPFVVEKLGWTGEAASLLRSGPITRLSSLLSGTRASVLDSPTHFDIRTLLAHPTIIEMGWFGTDEDKAFLLGALVLALAEARLADGAFPDLKHLLLIEEAHCLLAAPTVVGGSESAQPQQKAVRQFCNLLATIGGYGQGVFVVEQVPTKLAPDLLANTGVKIAHQLPLQQDCDAVGAAMTLNAAQRRFLPRLQRGEAVAFRAGDHGAFHIQVPDHAGKLGFSRLHISDAEVSAHMNRFNPQTHQLRA